MTQSIIYPNEETGSICLCRPAPECELPIDEIARKDVPAGVPYKIILDSDIPTDFMFFDAWQADFTNPDGYGIGHDAWYAEQQLKA